MPLVTIASAISLISFSLTLQANLFQLFQPIGGVLARPLSRARTSVKQNAKSSSDATLRYLFIFVLEASPPLQQRGQAPLPDLFIPLRRMEKNKSGRGACPRCWSRQCPHRALITTDEGARLSAVAFNTIRPAFCFD